MPIMSVNFFRIFLGFCILTFYGFLMNKSIFSVDRSRLKDYVVIGFIFALSTSMFNTANLYVPIQNVILLNATYPLFAMLFGYFLLGEKITPVKSFALICAFIGLIIINPIKGGENLFGNLLALSTGVTNGYFVVHLKKVSDKKGIEPVYWFIFFASLFLAPFMIYYGAGELMPNIIQLLILGCVCTGIAYVFFKKAMEGLDAGTGSIIEIVIGPIAAISLAYIILHEPLQPKMLSGGIFLISSSILVISQGKISFRGIRNILIPPTPRPVEVKTD